MACAGNTTPLPENLAHLTGSSPPSGRPPSFTPIPPALIESDAVFALIRQHRSAYELWYAASKGRDMTEAEGEVEGAALDAVIFARPTTLAGLVSWLEYAAMVVHRDDDWPTAMELLPLIAQAVRGFCPAASMDAAVGEAA